MSGFVINTGLLGVTESGCADVGVIMTGSIKFPVASDERWVWRPVET